MVDMPWEISFWIGRTDKSSCQWRISERLRGIKRWLLDSDLKSNLTLGKSKISQGISKILTGRPGIPYVLIQCAYN